MEYGINIDESILASIGSKISWIFKPILGTDSWGATVSAIQGLVAKEQVVSSMAVINGLADDVEEGAEIFSKGGVFEFFTAASAYAFMVFNLFSAPCFGAIGAMKKELGGNGKMIKAVIFQTLIAWILATIVYQIGSRIEAGVINVANVVVLTIIALIVFFIILNQIKGKDVECNNCPYCKDCTKEK